MICSKVGKYLKDQWLDPEFAKKWDKTALEGKSIRREQIDAIIFISKKHLKKQDAGINVVGVDYSPTMLSLARERMNSLNISRKVPPNRT
ncbi:MAG: hypothetical protein PWR06_448 [Thermoanaerobacteraceae bacterium]|nr:hypothetical protein [Thermoanaerobacteraceae bacterium]